MSNVSFKLSFYACGSQTSRLSSTETDSGVSEGCSDISSANVKSSVRMTSNRVHLFSSKINYFCELLAKLIKLAYVRQSVCARSTFRAIVR